MSRRLTRIAAALALIPAYFALAADHAANQSGIDPNGFDTKVRPQDDLFRHVNGGWIASTAIPAERSYYGSFIQLAEKAEANLRAIIEEAAKAGGPEGSEGRKVGDLYSSFMDEERADRLGLEPIKDQLEQVERLKDKAGLARLMGTLQRAGVAAAFMPFIDTDAKQSDRYIVSLNQGGLGLPDETYYREEKFKPIREAYVAHVARMLALVGRSEAAAKAEADRVMALETRLAKSHWDRVKSRDDTLTYNKMDREALAKLAPGFDWDGWLAATKAPEIRELIVRQPEYFAAMARAMEEVSLDDWKSWQTWNIARAHAPLLSKPFVEENFAFYGKTLTGAQENRPRWKRGVAIVEGAMGEAVGKLYVERHFPPAAASRMRDLVKNLIEAYREDIETLDWMSPETRKKALDKLAKFTPKIGYPIVWRDYEALSIARGDLVGNVHRADEFEFDRQLAKLGKPVDRNEWFMTPQTVNAYYNPGMNEIVFPAAILQPPFFDMNADDAVNYGGIGGVIGHEIGHGFDDQGSKFDGDGNMKDWWTESDRNEFDARAKKLIEQYDGFSPAQLPKQHVNGALTIGENIGDLGGLTLAYKAYKRSLGGKPSPVINGLTGEQRLFLGWARIWRSKYRDAELERRLATDPHSPTEFRCNGVVRNLVEFYDAFDVKEGDKLWLPSDQRVRIW